MTAREDLLMSRATNRVVRPFEWGVEWAGRWPCAARFPRDGHDPESYLRLLSQEAVQSSDEFFGYRKPQDFTLQNGWLRFTSAVETPHRANNTVHARWFPAGRTKSAVLVLPHWNAQTEQHVGLCRGLQVLGLPSLRLSLPYHDHRMPPELERADYAVSANVARTVDATRQAVIDIRSCLDWLESEGYRKLAIVGTSLGSCYAFLASAHDERLRVNVFNLFSRYFAEVVWTGISTRHIRQSVEEQIGLPRLRQAWEAITPANYVERFAAMPGKKSLFISAAYDTTFLPEYSQALLRQVRELGADFRAVTLPCGHYTLGEFPGILAAGYQICAFLKQWL